MTINSDQKESRGFLQIPEASDFKGHFRCDEDFDFIESSDEGMTRLSELSSVSLDFASRIASLAQLGSLDNFSVFSDGEEQLGIFSLMVRKSSESEERIPNIIGLKLGHDSHLEDSIYGLSSDN